MQSSSGRVGSIEATWRALNGGTYQDRLFVDIENPQGVPHIAVDTNGAQLSGDQSKRLRKLLKSAEKKLEHGSRT